MCCVNNMYQKKVTPELLYRRGLFAVLGVHTWCVWISFKFLDQKISRMFMTDEFFPPFYDEEPYYEPVCNLQRCLFHWLAKKKERPVWTPEAYVKKKTLKPRHREQAEWDTIFQFYPTTDDGFVESFEPSDFSTWNKILEKYGFVVLKNVRSHDQCDNTVAEFFDDLNRRAEVGYNINATNDRTGTTKTQNWSKGPYDLGKMQLPCWTQEVPCRCTSPDTTRVWEQNRSNCIWCMYQLAHWKNNTLKLTETLVVCVLIRNDKHHPSSLMPLNSVTSRQPTSLLIFTDTLHPIEFLTDDFRRSLLIYWIERICGVASTIGVCSEAPRILYSAMRMEMRLLWTETIGGTTCDCTGTTILGCSKNGLMREILFCTKVWLGFTPHLVLMSPQQF